MEPVDIIRLIFGIIIFVLIIAWIIIKLFVPPDLADPETRERISRRITTEQGTRSTGARRSTGRIARTVSLDRTDQSPVRTGMNRVERRSSNSRRLLKKITPAESETRWQFTRKEDTCWSCGEKLAVESMVCRSCGERRIICSICRKNVDREDRIGACPACGNHFHYPHLREAVKVAGACPACRNRVRMDEVIELGQE